MKALLKKIGMYIGIFFAIILCIYGLLWLWGTQTYPTSFGISFSQTHASSLGLDWKQVYIDMFEELEPPFIRIAAMWSDVEAEQGTYDFADVDWMMNKAAEYNSKVVLVIGQKAPRWPECHVPEWYKDLSEDERKEALFAYVRESVTRYKDHPALELWQVENEPYIGFAFGECEGYDRELVPQEIDITKEIDPNHPIIITDSGELGTWWRAAREGDYFGTTLYRVVRLPNGKVFSYNWLPAGWFKLKAKLTGVNPDTFFVSELQAEPWFTDENPEDVSIERQEETMDPVRLEEHVEFARKVGASRAYLWGVEWWYFMKQEHGDSRYWELVDQVIFNTRPQ